MKKKVFTRILVIALAAVILLSQLAFLIPVLRATAASDVVLTVQTVMVMPRDTFTVAVNVSEASDLVGGAFTLRYDADLMEFVSIKAGSAMQGAIVSCAQSSNKLSVSYAAGKPAEKAGSVVLITFKAAKLSKAQTVELVYREQYFLDSTGDEIAHTINQGSVHIDPTPRGDVNGDGSIDNSDAQMILKYLTGKITLTEIQKSAADLSGDGVLNTVDATMILSNTPQSGTQDQLPTNTTASSSSSNSVSSTSGQTGVVVNTEGDGVNVRTGPGTGYNKIGNFPEGSTITILEHAANGWYKASGNDKTTGAAIEGYCSGEYVALGS